ncbi:MAG: hypothetical protein H7318_14915 [Oligoflexus sp.]|nr:hypothetical protein [Oligoflexus sp.]
MKTKSIFLGAVLTLSSIPAFAQEATQSQKIIAIQQAKITKLETSLNNLTNTVLGLQKSLDELKQNTDTVFVKKTDADARFVTNDGLNGRINQCRIRIGRNNNSWGPYNNSETNDVSTVPWTGDQNIVYDFRCDSQSKIDIGIIHVLPGIGTIGRIGGGR